MRRAAFSLATGVAVVLALAFLFLPVLAIFLRVSPGDLAGRLDDRVVLDALTVTAKTNGIAFAITLLVGTPAAYLIAAKRFPGRALAITLCELPLVLPPAVAGIGLLAAFGRLGLLGGTLDALGIHVGLTQAAVVLAVLFVAGPFYLRQAIAAFEAVDPTMLAAARTLGAGPGRTFARVALPLASGGLGAGAALSLARGIGEFGATIMFAGSLQGVTQTLSLAIYAQFGVDFSQALAMGALLVLVSAAVLLTIKAVPLWRGWTSTSFVLSAPSSSH
jgi:molybdate transport system permease protein